MSIPEHPNPEETRRSPTPEVVLATSPVRAADGLGEELVRWRSHPLRRGGRRLALVIAVLVGMPTGLTILYGPFFGLLGLIILAGSLGTYFLPTDYVLYRDGLESRFLGVSRRFRWGQFRSFYRDRHGVLLSPFSRPSRLENFRGLYVRFGSRADGVMAVVSEKVRPPRDPNADSGAESSPGERKE